MEFTERQLAIPRIVARSVNIPEWLMDEAESEGWVVLCEAAAKYDPSHKVPLDAYLFQRVRWGLIDWQRREYRERTAWHSEDALALQPHHTYDTDTWLDFQTVLTTCNERERTLLVGRAAGLSPTEIASVVSGKESSIRERRSRIRQRVLQQLTF